MKLTNQELTEAGTVEFLQPTFTGEDYYYRTGITEKSTGHKLQPALGVTAIKQNYFDSVEWVFQFDDDEPQVLATPINGTKELTITIGNNTDSSVHFFGNGKTFKIFTREKL
jgi:hypothetical protein